MTLWIAQSLEAWPKKKIVHVDRWPGKIIVTDDGVLKLLDHRFWTDKTCREHTMHRGRSHPGDRKVHVARTGAGKED
jgi:hypothetical protein